MQIYVENDPIPGHICKIYVENAPSSGQSEKYTPPKWDIYIYIYIHHLWGLYSEFLVFYQIAPVTGRCLKSTYSPELGGILWYIAPRLSNLGAIYRSEHSDFMKKSVLLNKIFDLRTIFKSIYSPEIVIYSPEITSYSPEIAIFCPQIWTFYLLPKLSEVVHILYIWGLVGLYTTI